jgi:hypothetical protein
MARTTAKAPLTSGAEPLFPSNTTGAEVESGGTGVTNSVRGAHTSTEGPYPELSATVTPFVAASTFRPATTTLPRVEFATVR